MDVAIEKPPRLAGSLVHVNVFLTSLLCVVTSPCDDSCVHAEAHSDKNGDDVRTICTEGFPVAFVVFCRTVRETEL